MCFTRIFLVALLLSKNSSAAAQEPPAKTFQEVLSVAGWTAERLGQLKDGEPLDSMAQAEVARLLLRLQSIPPTKLSEWAQGEVDLETLRDEPASGRGELFHLTGRVVGVLEERLDETARAALEEPTWYVCEMRLEQGAIVEVIARAIPPAWSELSPLEEPVACNAVFVRTTDNGRLQFVAPHIAWYPVEPDPPLVNFGMATLGSLGVDLAEWISLKRAGGLTSADFTAFYEALAAMRKIDASQLAELAQGNLTRYAKPYREELSKLHEEAARTTRRGAILREIVTTANEGRFSVWPLFLEADRQQGQLVVLDGVVRRAVKVDTSIDREGDTSDAFTRFGIEHYYELELFTEDSQNKPLVFCVLELPAGFATGDDLHEPVRMAGFLFKVWVYRGRQSVEAEGASSEGREAAPLLIGRGPLQIAASVESSAWMNGAVGGLLGLAIASIWFVSWWFGREDKRFEKTTLAKVQMPPESLRIEIPEIRGSEE